MTCISVDVTLSIEGLESDSYNSNKALVPNNQLGTLPLGTH